MKFTFAAVALAAVLLPAPAVSSASASDVKEAAKESPAVSTQQNLRRRANVFNNNSANVDIIVVLKDEGRRRKLNGIAGKQHLLKGRLPLKIIRPRLQQLPRAWEQLQH